MVEIVPIDTASLGDRSYLAHDGDVGVVIDPQRDFDRVTALADAKGVRITHVAETHMHNDYITGGCALARATGAQYLVNDADEVGFERTGVRDGDTIDVGDQMRVQVLATPGHTFTHLSYVLVTRGGVAGVFTGGSLLYGSTGRPDLLGAENTPALARAQYSSARQLAEQLPESAQIFPTHGFGSFCAVTQSAQTASTFGREKQVNPVLTLDERDYVAALLRNLDVWPAYYAHMAPANAAGPAAPDLSAPTRTEAGDVRRRIEAGEWVIDLRNRVAFAAGFLRGSLAFSLEDSFASYLGWMIPWGIPLTLLGESAEQVALAQRELVRIGIDRPAGAVTGRPAEWADGQPLASLPLAKFGDLAARMDEPGASAGAPVPAPDEAFVVLDVRRPLEWAESHLAGAVHIPLHELPGRIGEVPPGTVWVHCHTGYRALAGASILAARGRTVVSIDDDFGNAAPTGLPLQSA
jgi:glyoxylase-like metal-dependent hydrolase (beta-lactamase superfamily II)/rhodanese-related sulfurtransferase